MGKIPSSSNKIGIDLLMLTGKKKSYSRLLFSFSNDTFAQLYRSKLGDCLCHVVFMLCYLFSGFGIPDQCLTKWVQFSGHEVKAVC